MGNDPCPFNRSRHGQATAPSEATARLDPRPRAAPAPGRKEVESGGPKGREPTRYGDWESKGIAVDF